MNERVWFRRTRSADFLWRGVAVLAAVVFALGTAASFLNTERMDAYQRIVAMPSYSGDGMGFEFSTASARMERAVGEVFASGIPFHEKLDKIAYVFYYFPTAEPIAVTAPAHFSAAQRAIAEALVSACSASSNSQKRTALERLAAGADAAPDANYALALVQENRDNREGYEAALDALSRENALHGSAHARARTVRIYAELQKYEVLEVLCEQPDYAPCFSARLLQQMALRRGDWPAVLQNHFLASYAGVVPAMVVFALFSGLLWALIVIWFGGSFRRVWKFLVPGLALGALSAHATLLLIYWMRYHLGFEPGENDLGQLVYCLGIGFREEGLKLLLFAPLIPFLSRRDDLEIITVAGLVGLGFALEENINYFQSSAGLSAVGRFATANFLHIALTAMCGLTLTRAVAHRGEDVAHAATTFILAAAAHAAYDAFIIMPLLEDWSWLCYTVFVLIGYQYFGWLRHARPAWRAPISATSVFTFAAVVVTGLTFGLYAWNHGLLPAVRGIVGEVVGTAVILFMFYREIPETVD